MCISCLFGDFNVYGSPLSNNIRLSHRVTPTDITTSYPGSFFGKDPGSGWSHDSHFLGAELTFFCGRGGRGACAMKFKFATRNREENS